MQQLTCKIDLPFSFYYLFLSFVLLELKPFVLKETVLGENYEKVPKIMKRVKSSETISPFSCCPLAFLWTLPMRCQETPWGDAAKTNKARSCKIMIEGVFSYIFFLWSKVNMARCQSTASWRCLLSTKKKKTLPGDLALKNGGILGEFSVISLFQETQHENPPNGTNSEQNLAQNSRLRFRKARGTFVLQPVWPCDPP